MTYLFVDPFYIVCLFFQASVLKLTAKFIWKLPFAVQVNMLVDEEGVSLQKYFPILK